MEKTSPIALVVGGIRSGKSTWAEQLALQGAAPRFYLATTRPSEDDLEMQERIRKHRERRTTQDWLTTIEEAHDLLGVFASAPLGSTWLLECLPLWLAANAFPENAPMRDESWVYNQCLALLEIWRTRNLHVVAVSAESGLGLLPMDAAARRWVDLLGRMNQTLAADAHAVWFCSCGIPMRLK